MAMKSMLETDAAMMPQTTPTKRSVKTSKLAKMNEQERARYLEKRMAEEEEAKRRKEAMINAFLRLKLDHEEKTFSLNNAKLIERWRTILRQCKNEELRNDVKMLAESFNRALTKKASHIELLLQELKEEEDQYNETFRAEVEMITKMNEVYNQRLLAILARHEVNADRVSQKNEAERKRLALEGEEGLAVLGDVMIANNQRHKDLVDRTRSSHLEVYEDMRNKSLEERQSLQIQLEEKMENLWVQLHDSAKGHRSATEEKRRVYQELRRRDKTGLAEVLENNKKLLKLMEDSGKLKETLAEVGNLEQRRLSGLRQERDDLLRMLHKKRKLISVKHANAKRAEVKRISVMVDKLQKAVAEVAEFQTKMARLAAGGGLFVGVTQDEASLLKETLLEEGRQLRRRKDRLTQKLGGDLSDIKNMLQNNVH